MTNISFDYSTETDTGITLPLMNYPGYIAENQDGIKIKLQENNNHMIIIPLQKGKGEIRVFYAGLTIFKIADYISLLSLLVLIYYTIFCYKHRKLNRFL